MIIVLEAKYINALTIIFRFKTFQKIITTAEASDKNDPLR